MDPTLERIKRYLEAQGITGPAPLAGAPELDAEIAPPPAPAAPSPSDDRFEVFKRYFEKRMADDSARPPDLTDDERLASGLRATGTNAANLFLQRAGLPGTVKNGPTAQEARQAQIRDYLTKKNSQMDSLAVHGLSARPDNTAFNMAELERRQAADKARADQATRGLDLRGRDLDLKELELERKKNRPPKPPKGAADPSGLPVEWELLPESHATKTQNEAFEKLVFADKKMRGLTNKMRQMLTKYGAMRLVPGPAQNDIKQLATELQIETKNVAELGAVSGPDMGLMTSIAGDPSKLGSVARDLDGMLNGLEHWGQNTVDAKSTSIGARRKAGQGSAGGDVAVRRKSDGVTKRMPAEAAKKFANDPGYEVAP